MNKYNILIFTQMEQIELAVLGVKTKLREYMPPNVWCVKI